MGSLRSPEEDIDVLDAKMWFEVSVVVCVLMNVYTVNCGVIREHYDVQISGNNYMKLEVDMVEKDKDIEDPVLANLDQDEDEDADWDDLQDNLNVADDQDEDDAHFRRVVDEG